jgi:hypothetical protein
MKGDTFSILGKTWVSVLRNLSTVTTGCYLPDCQVSCFEVSTVDGSDKLTLLHKGQLHQEVHRSLQGVPGSYLITRSAVPKYRLLLSLMS